jgi:hypothetical protein
MIRRSWRLGPAAHAPRFVRAHERADNEFRQPRLTALLGGEVEIFGILRQMMGMMGGLTRHTPDHCDGPVLTAWFDKKGS